MSIGKMNTFIDIISTVPIKDDEGFVNTGDNILASVRAYKEERRGSEKWANMAAFSTATVLFRFRKISGLTVDTAMFITDSGGRYRIVSTDDVRGRGMYVEVLCEKLEGSIK
jgi:head-tail adaptor